MDKTAPTRSRKVLFWIRILKGLFFYALVPLALLLLLAGPVSRAVRRSETAVWLILLAALGAVAVNWIVYSFICRKRPSLLVFSHGIFCLLLVLIVEAEALLDNDAMSSVLTMAGGLLVLLLSILFYFWLASRHSKAGHSAAVFIRIMLDITLCVMAYRIWRDIETGISDADTWTTAGVILMILLGFQLPGIIRAVRRSASRRRATGGSCRLSGKHTLTGTGILSPPTSPTFIIRWMVQIMIHARIFPASRRGCTAKTLLSAIKSLSFIIRTTRPKHI